MLGTRIKQMRTQKQVSQTELARALNVSPQTVSKWENHISSPDISILPLLANYFEITMDDLFSYRLERLNYKERFIRFLYENNMLCFGTFILKSGRKSPYIVHSGHNHLSSRLSHLGSFYAEGIRENALADSCLIGTSKQDIALVAATVTVMLQRYDIDMQYCTENTLLKYIEPQVKLTLLTDTFTSGETLKKELESVKRLTGRIPKNILVGVDRMEQSEHAFFAARQEIEFRYGAKIFSIVSFEDIICAVEKGIIPAKQFLPSLYEYKRKYYGVI